MGADTGLLGPNLGAIFLLERLGLDGGRLAGEFLLLYAAARIIGECFRSAEDGFILGLTAGQFWTLPFVVLGSILVFRTRRSVE